MKQIGEAREAQARRVEPDEDAIGLLTGEIFAGIFGRPPARVLEERGAASPDDVCDHLEADELRFVTFGEFPATQLVEARDAQGFEQCLVACRDAGRLVGDAYDAVRGASGGGGTPID